MENIFSVFLHGCIDFQFFGAVFGEYNQAQVFDIKMKSLVCFFFF